MGVWAKLAQVMSKVDWVPKNGYNAFHKYHYATEADLTSSIRGLLVAEGLAFFASVLEQHRDGEFTKVQMEFTIADAETGEAVKSIFWGEGQDKADKGLYKAYTGATKYFLMKTLLIPTGDDPEDDGGKPPQTGRQDKPFAKAADQPAPPPKPVAQSPSKPAADGNPEDAEHPNKTKITQALCKSIYIQGGKLGMKHDDVHNYARNLFQDPNIQSLYDLGQGSENYQKVLQALAADASKRQTA